MSKRLAGAWLAFSLDTDETEAVRHFVAKHGRAPAQVVRGKGLLLVGPLEENGRTSDPVEPGSGLPWQEVTQ